MFCPLVNKECIKSCCIAYKVKSNIMFCDTCKKSFILGKKCDCRNINYVRHIGSESYCNNYNKKILIKD